MDTLGPPQADPSTTTSRKALLLSFENAGYLKPFFALFVDIGIFAGGLTLVLMDGRNATRPKMSLSNWLLKKEP